MGSLMYHYEVSAAVYTILYIFTLANHTKCFEVHPNTPSVQQHGFSVIAQSLCSFILPSHFFFSSSSSSLSSPFPNASDTWSLIKSDIPFPSSNFF